ncbi:MAG: alpha/beta hydrolase [Mycobacteriales bacterium]
MLLDATDGGCWTVHIARDGRLSCSEGEHPHPTTTVRADLATLTEVVSGRESGVGAFLHGRVLVRGNLALSLQLDGVFADDVRPERYPRSRSVLAGDLRTTYLEAGPANAPVVLCLHGLGATNASMLPTVWDLAADHRVIAPDLPGHGASGKPHASYSAAWFGRWLRSFCEALALEDVLLVGNSLGGRIALEGGLLMPDRVRGMVLLAPSPAFRRLRQFVPLVRVLRPEMAALPLPMTHRLAVRGLRRMFAVPSRLPAQWYDAACDEFVRIFATRGGRVAFFSCLRQIYLEEAFGQDGFWTRLATLRPPALFVWGDRDRLVPAGFARHVVDAVPHAQSVVLTNCGHVPQFELPEQTSALITEFLTELS